MDLEEIITDLNFDIDNEEAQEKAKDLKAKLKKRGMIILLTSSILLGISLIAFIILLIIGLMNYNETILFSIIPFVVMVLSIFGVFFGVTYNNLSKQIIIKEKTDEA